jgi:predicted DNA-binding transcriptional regulator
LHDVLRELSERNLLGRVARVHVGNVELIFTPQATVADPRERSEEDIRKQIDELERELEDHRYGSS